VGDRLLYDLSGSYTIAFAIGIAVSLLSAVRNLAGVAAQGEGGRGPDAQGAWRARPELAVMAGHDG
jgi:hypothetical protein